MMKTYVSALCGRLTIPGHANGQTLSVAAILASVAVLGKHYAFRLARTSVIARTVDASTEETLQ